MFTMLFVWKGGGGREGRDGQTDTLNETFNARLHCDQPPQMHRCAVIHITPVLSTLHWLPVRFRITFKVLLFVFKSRHGLAPSYISDLLENYVPTRSLRSADTFLLVVPIDPSWFIGVIEPSPQLPRNSGINFPSTSNRRPLFLFLKHVLKPFFILKLLIRSEF